MSNLEGRLEKKDLVDPVGLRSLGQKKIKKGREDTACLFLGQEESVQKQWCLINFDARSVLGNP